MSTRRRGALERWSDHASVLVDHEKDEFQPVAALLKAWAARFDIFRLDQQHFPGSYFVDREERTRFGVEIWLANFASYQDQNLGALEDAPRAGTSLLGINSRCLDPVLEQLLGLDFKSLYRADDYLRVTRPHVITREVAQKKDMQDVSENPDRSWIRTARSGGSNCSRAASRPGLESVGRGDFRCLNGSGAFSRAARISLLAKSFFPGRWWGVWATSSRGNSSLRRGKTGAFSDG